MNTSETQNSTVEFIKTFSNYDEMTQQILEIFNSIMKNTKDIYTFHSGGGHVHIGLLLNNNKVLTYHTVTETLEISYAQYESLKDYFENDLNDEKEIGFGWEINAPDYDSRHIESPDFDHYRDFIASSIVSSFRFSVEWGKDQYNGEKESDFDGSLISEKYGWSCSLIRDFSLLDVDDELDYLGSLYDIKVTRLK